MAGADELGQRFFGRSFFEHRRLMSIEQCELRIDGGFERKLAQQPRTKAVNGRDDRTVERSFVTHPTRALTRFGRSQKFVHFPSEPFAHFVSRAVGERDRYDLIYADVVGAKNVEVALDEHRGLAGAGTGRHSHVPIECVCGLLLLGLKLASFSFNNNAHSFVASSRSFGCLYGRPSVAPLDGLIVSREEGRPRRAARTSLSLCYTSAEP